MPFLARFSPHARGFGFLDPVAADGATPAAATISSPTGGVGQVESCFVPPPLVGSFVAGDLVEAEADLEDDGRATATAMTLKRRDLAVQVGVVQPGPGGLIAERDQQLGGGWIRVAPELTEKLRTSVNRQVVLATTVDDEGRSVAHALVAGPHVPKSPKAERARAVVVALGRASPKQVPGGALAVGLADDSTQAMHDHVTGMLANGGRGLAAGLDPTGTVPGAAQAPVDRRSLALVTIDAPSSRDLDDAITATWSGDPTAPVRVGVFIADPAAVVGIGSAADRYAKAVGATAYAIGADNAPMLDPALSEDACSLLPGVDRNAIGVWLLVAPDGAISATTLERALVRSTARLSYDEVEAQLDGDRGPVEAAGAPHGALVADVVAATAEAARRLGLARLDRPTLEDLFTDAQLRPALDANGRLVTVAAETAPRANKLVERLMVATNEAVALWLADRDAPAPFRVHEGIDRDKLPRVIAAATQAGAQLPSGAGGATSTDLDAFALEVRAEITRLARVNPRGHDLLATVVTGSTARASYAATPGPHRGLGATAYVHFTSPIRRYADLLVHRQVRALLAGEELPYDAATITKLGRWLDVRAGALNHAESLERNGLLARLIDRGNLVEGEPATITGINPAGLMVRLDRLGLGGFVTAEALLDLPRGDRGKLVVDDNGFDTDTAGGHRLGGTIRVTAKGLDQTGRPRLVPSG